MLLNSTQLARKLGVSTWLPKAVKVAAVQFGDSPFIGRYTTEIHRIYQKLKPADLSAAAAAIRV